MPSPVPSPHRRGLRGDAPGRPAHPTAVGATPVSVSPWKFPGLGTRCQLSPRPGGRGLSSESHAPPRVVARSADRDAEDVPPAHAGLATAAPAAAPLAEKWGSLGDAAEGMPGGEALAISSSPLLWHKVPPRVGRQGVPSARFFWGGVCVCAGLFPARSWGAGVPPARCWGGKSLESLLQGAGGSQASLLQRAERGGGGFLPQGAGGAWGSPPARNGGGSLRQARGRGRWSISPARSGPPPAGGMPGEPVIPPGGEGIPSSDPTRGRGGPLPFPPPPPRPALTVGRAAPCLAAAAGKTRETPRRG